MASFKNVPHLFTTKRNQSFLERKKEYETRKAREAALESGASKEVPFDMVRTMFKQRMQAIMMQDRRQLRRVFEEFDIEKRGQLNLDQFHGTMCKLCPGMTISRETAAELMKRFSNEPGYILFQDFVVNFLGLPPDFFSMKLSQDNPNAAEEKPAESKVKEFKYGTPIEKVEKTFVRRMRKRLLNVKAAMSVALKRPGETVTYFDEHALWYLMRDQGMMCTQKEVNEIMEHFDQNRDGKIHYEEFAHELLGLPRPAAVRHVQPFYGRRPPLSEQAQQLIHRLAIKCERAAAAPTRLHAMFKGFDKDGSGSIAYDEFLCMVQEFGCEMEGNDAAASLLTRFDKDGQGELSYTEFVTDVLGLQPSALNKDNGNSDRCSTPEMMQSVSNNLKRKIFSDRAAIIKAFEAFDKDHGGSLSYPEFRDGIKALGLPISTSQAKQLFAEFNNGSHRGEISTEGFAADVLGVNSDELVDELGASGSLLPPPGSAMSRPPGSAMSRPPGTAMSTMSRMNTHRSRMPTRRSAIAQLPIRPTPRIMSTPGAAAQLRKSRAGKTQGGAPRMPDEFMPARSKSSLDGRMTRRSPHNGHLTPMVSQRSRSVSRTY